MEGDWSLTVTGTIIQVESIDVDKSGRNPKLFYEFSVRPDSLQSAVGDVQLSEVLTIRIKDMELSRLSMESLDVGDRVMMTAKANGPKPTLFYLTAVTKLDLPR